MHGSFVFLSSSFTARAWREHELALAIASVIAPIGEARSSLALADSGAKLGGRGRVEGDLAMRGGLPHRENRGRNEIAVRQTGAPRCDDRKPTAGHRLGRDRPELREQTRMRGQPN